MIRKQDILDRAAEWQLRAEVVEKDYVLGWLLAGLGEMSFGELWLTGVLSERLLMAGIGVVAGALGGFALARIVGSSIQNVQLPGALPAMGAAIILLAARAARVDVVQALRAD